MMLRYTVAICFIMVGNIVVNLLTVAVYVLINYENEVLGAEFQYYSDLTGFDPNKVELSIQLVKLFFGLVIFVTIAGVIAATTTWHRLIIMYVYVVFVSLFLTLVAILIVLWIMLMLYLLEDLKDRLNNIMSKYESEYASNTESILFDLLQRYFDSCGVESEKDWSNISKAPEWNKARKNEMRIHALGEFNLAWPLSCCRASTYLTDMIVKSHKRVSFHNIMSKGIELKECSVDPNKNGVYAEGKTFLMMILVLGSGFLIFNLVFFGSILCACIIVINEERGKLKQKDKKLRRRKLLRRRRKHKETDKKEQKTTDEPNNEGVDEVAEESAY